MASEVEAITARLASLDPSQGPPHGASISEGEREEIILDSQPPGHATAAAQVEALLPSTQGEGAPLSDTYDGGLDALFAVSTGTLPEQPAAVDLKTRDVVSVGEAEAAEVLGTRDILTVDLDRETAALLEEDPPMDDDIIEVKTRDMVIDGD